MNVIKSALSLLALGAVIGSALAQGASSEVYVQTNAASGNQVLVYAHGNDGVLNLAGSYWTGGTGSGAGLGSQAALTLNESGNRLYAVDAGSNDVAVFAVEGRKLRKLGNFWSGGTTPISVTANAGLVYVVNAGGSGNIAGFQADESGELDLISGSIKPLSGNNVGPAEIELTPSGNAVVVTEKNTALIDTWPILGNGAPGALVTTHSNGATPFGFDFDAAGRLFVSEAPGSSASSYWLGAGGWNTISASVANHQAAACWLKVSPDGRFAFTGNSGNNTISGYSISASGQLALLTPSGLAASTGPGSHPVDLGFTNGGRFLYVLTNANGTIAEFRVADDGSLMSIGTVTGIPTSSQGLTAK